MPEIPVKLFYDTNISNELAVAVSLSSKPNQYYYKLVFEIFTKQNLSPQFALEFLSRLEYEKPNFKEHILIPFSFIYILNLLSEYLFDERNHVNKEFVESFNNIISKFNNHIEYKILFKKLTSFLDEDEIETDPDDDGNSLYVMFINELENEIDEETLYSIDITQKFRIPVQFYDAFISI